MEYGHAYNLYNEIWSFPFVLYKVTKNFSGNTSFSTSHLTLSCIFNDEGSAAVSVPFSRIFSFSPALLEKQEGRPPNLLQSIDKLITCLKRCRTIRLSENLSGAQNEKDVVVVIAKHVFDPLFGKLTFEKGYKNCLSKWGLHCDVENLGVGSEKTWHGSTEVCIQDCSIINTAEDFSINQYYDSEEENTSHFEANEAHFDESTFHLDANEQSTSHLDASEQSTSHLDESTPHLDANEDSTSHLDYKPGETHAEGKIAINLKDHVSQLVTTCVTTSFIEHNLNSNLNPAVPTILFNKNSFRICIYDCKEDVLLISEPRLLTGSKYHRLSKSACLILWIVAHHR